MESDITICAFRKALAFYAVPEFVEHGMEIEEAFHPLIAEPVANSFTLERGMLLTGSNASGKSTFLKTVEICALLAQTIQTVPAKKYSAERYRIYSSMSLRDDLENGESYYMVEIRSIKRILEAAKEPGTKVLCLVDEVLRGTNTVERIAAASEIMRSFTGENILCFAATHDIELTQLLADVYDNYHFEEQIENNDIDLVIFLRDPLTPKSHEPDVNKAVQLCDMHNVPLGTNLATAELLIKALDRGDLEWREMFR